MMKLRKKMSESEKRVALISGCGKENGIGAATARRLARDGMIVVVTDVAAAGVDNDQSLERSGAAWQGLDTLVARIEAAGGCATSLTGDVSTEEGAAYLVGQTIERQQFHAGSLVSVSVAEPRSRSRCPRRAAARS